MAKIIRRLKDSLEYRGVLGTLILLSRIPLNFLIGRTSIARRIKDYRDKRYDRKFFVDTSGHMQLNELDIDSPNRQHGSWYEGIDPDVFDRMIASVPIQHHDFTFVDFGSGKGKALLMASEYPFKEIVGVEFSSQLHEIAQRNIKTYRSITQKCRALTAVCMDATDFPIPHGNLLIYMANPFYGEVMEKVLRNIKSSTEAHPREVFIVYFNPQCGPLLDGMGFLTKPTHKGGSYFSLYKCVLEKEFKPKSG